MNNPNQNEVRESQLDRSTCEAFASKLAKVKEEISRVLFDRDSLVDSTLAGIISGGHILLEGLPGLGKTQLVKCLCSLLGLETSRVQFTPDLLPSDITGSNIIQDNAGRREFSFIKGPVFSNLLLADEINRSSPRTQSALLEAMQERTVTVQGNTYELPNPFIVIATQNPIDLEGTYSLPEAQLDRFIIKVNLKPTSESALQRIVSEKTVVHKPVLSQVLTKDELCEIMQSVPKVFIAPPVVNIIAKLINATQSGRSEIAEKLKFGISPRAAIALANLSKSYALIRGNNFVDLSDVKRALEEVFQHRIMLNYEAKIKGETPESIINKIYEEVLSLNDVPNSIKIMEGSL